MKKTISIILLLLCISLLSACKDTETVQSETPSHTHVFGEWTLVKEETCTEGKEEVRSCECGETEERQTEAAGHTEVIDAAVSATCTTDGKTEGKHCSVCNEVIVEQTVVAKLGHTEVIDKAVKATCTKGGKTEGKHCSVCNEIITPQTATVKLGHTVVIDKAVKATCTKEGKTEGKHCSVCNKVLKAQKTTKKLGHTEVIDKAVKATCAKEGKTEGKHCSVCNEVLKAQESIEKLEHTVEKIPRVEPTCITKGKTSGKVCTVCNEIIKEQKELETSEHTFGEWSVVKYATKTKTGKRSHTCTVCNKTETDVIDKREYNSAFGSAYKFSETTIIVSIFANNDSYQWDLNSPEDVKAKELMYEHLINGCSWLEIQGENYGVDTKFICDWKANPDLYYEQTFEGTGSSTQQREFIETNIDSEELLQKHNAQNILYFVYYDVPETITTRSWCASKAPNSSASHIELINILDRMQYEDGKYIYTPAATFAHEILHAFGAPDLYSHSSRITKEYVAYLASINSSDIMFTVNFGQSVSVFFSELCAYYVGLTDKCEDVEKWGLAQSYYLIPESEYVYSSQ